MKHINDFATGILTALFCVMAALWIAAAIAAPAAVIKFCVEYLTK